MSQLQQFFASYSNLIDLCLLNGILAYAVYLALSANMFTLATGGFMSIGAYCSAYLSMESGAPFLLALLAGAVLASLMALAIGAPVLRLRGDYFMLATFSFTQVVQVVALNWESVTGGALGIVNIPRLTQTSDLVILLVVCVVLVAILRQSYFGRAIATIREDEVIAQSMGIDVFAHRLSLFVASGFLSGLAGGLAAHLNFFIGPGDFGLARSVDALAFPILGGANNLLGPLLGAIVTTLLPETLRFSNQLREILTGGLILAVVLYLPGGMLSVFRLRNSRRRKTRNAQATLARVKP